MPMVLKWMKPIQMIATTTQDIQVSEVDWLLYMLLIVSL